jgi:hypothetical protein
MLKALYGMLAVYLLFYKKFRKGIESIGFVGNPYDACIANKIMDGKQHTFTWHVDDIKSSHYDPKVNDDFAQWRQKTYGNEETGHATVTRGDKHDYLVITLNYSEEGKLKVDMQCYIDSMIKEFPGKLTRRTAIPWAERLMKNDKNSPKLSKERAQTFHTFVMKMMFFCKHGRLDVNLGVSTPGTRVKEPNKGNWNKLIWKMNFLKQTQEDVLTLEADNSQTLTQYVDTAFAVHPDMTSHNGAMFTLGKGALISDSTKQKTSSRSSTKAELNGIDDETGKTIWIKRFIEAQGFTVNTNVIYQDNQSTIKLSNNGNQALGEESASLIKNCFFVTDLIEKGQVKLLTAQLMK